jgi:hypothetical protein
MNDYPSILINNIPLPYLFGIDELTKTLFLNDEHTTGYMWDTKFRYYALELKEKYNYTLKYI